MAVVEFERGVDISRDPSLLLNQTACHCCAGGRTEHQVVHIWKCGTRRRGEERRGRQIHRFYVIDLKAAKFSFLFFTPFVAILAMHVTTTG